MHHTNQVGAWLRVGRRLLVALCAVGSLPSVGIAAFQHPGILNNKVQLEFIKERIQAGDLLWKTAFENMKASTYGSLNYTPTPRASVDCGSSSNPDYGCTDEKKDVVAAYTMALLWYFTDQEAYAKKSIEIMDAWSAVLKTHTLSNAPLQAAWCAAQFPRAAEIIKATYPAWSATEIDQFSTMLKTAYLPLIKDGSASNGNWEISMIEALMDIGVFLDDQTLFDKSISMWRKRIPAYFYLKKDGASPIPPPTGSHPTLASMITFWYGQSQFEDGLSQETCRDFGHVQYGLASTLNGAETAYLQGVDLYSEQSDRLPAALEFHAAYLDGKPAPNWLCGGTLTLSVDPTWEIGYNHYHNRKGLALPWTDSLIRSKVRPSGVDHMMAWETLTHAQLGVSAGVGTTPNRMQDSPIQLVFTPSGGIHVVRKATPHQAASIHSLSGVLSVKP